jgi:3-isopropylmalate dehydratase, large subunit (EC 4.2.1.33)
MLDSNFKELKIDISEIEPLIAFPYSPGNIATVSEYTGKHVDQVYIGNCSNGTISDLREAAYVLDGKK